MRITTTVFFLLFFFIECLAQTPPSDRQQVVRVEAPVIALTHVRVIVGTGAAPLEDARIGSIAVGKQDDLMVVKGNPDANIADIEKVEIVFKDGVGYDSEKLIQSVQG